MIDGNDIWEALFGIMKGNVPEALTEDVLEQLATALRTPSPVLEVAKEALEASDEALRDYACHGGEGVPCLRTADQCASECGKAAGNALLKVEAALQTLKEGMGSDVPKGLGDV